MKRLFLAPLLVPLSICLIRPTKCAAANNTSAIQEVSALPSKCNQGEIYNLTSGTAGQNLYICTSADTLTPAVAPITFAANTFFGGPASGADAAGSSRTLVSSDLPSKSLFLHTLLPNGTPAGTITSSVGSGDTDIYTCPTGKRCAIFGSTVYNNTASSAHAIYPEVKISGTYYRIGATQTPTANAGQTLFSTLIVLHAGQSYSVNCDASSSFNITALIFTFDNTANLTSGILTGPSSGNNTLYTVPNGKSACGFVTTSILGSSTVNYAAGGTATGNVTLNVVPSGGSPGATNQISTAGGDTGTNNTTTRALGFTCMTAGDFINVNITTGNAAQIVWVNILEQ